MSVVWVIKEIIMENENPWRDTTVDVYLYKEKNDVVNHVRRFLDAAIENMRYKYNESDIRYRTTSPEKFEEDMERIKKHADKDLERFNKPECKQIAIYLEDDYNDTNIKLVVEDMAIH